MKSKQLRSLERLGQRKVSPDEVIGRELARAMAAVSTELNRQIGLLIHRSGKVETVIVGDYDRIVIPALSQVRTAGGRLRGLRCVHTSFGQSGPDEEDIMDMACLRLDLMAVLTVREGYPDLLHTVHLIPGRVDGKDWQVIKPVHPAAQEQSCIELIEALEDEFARAAGVQVVDRVIQRRRKIHPRFILGRGKLMEIMLMSLRNGANLLLFDQELSPSQIRSVTDHTDLRVIDRTQLILDIFASRARSREGKLQIEMAQLKYLLPMLATRDDALSRLTGGIIAETAGASMIYRLFPWLVTPMPANPPCSTPLPIRISRPRTCCLQPWTRPPAASVFPETWR